MEAGVDSVEGASAADQREESASDEIANDPANRDAFEEIDFGQQFQDYLDPGYKTQEYEYKEDAPTFEQFLTKAPSLAEHLEWQLHMDPIEGDVPDAAICVIGNLDADGRLTASNEEIAAMGPWPEEVIETARQAVMRLDPVGCGAREVRGVPHPQRRRRNETLARQLCFPGALILFFLPDRTPVGASFDWRLCLLLCGRSHPWPGQFRAYCHCERGFHKTASHRHRVRRGFRRARQCGSQRGSARNALAQGVSHGSRCGNL